jgi:CsoR family transcriptional regulator, copper-sensing transcriptional repressor
MMQIENDAVKAQIIKRLARIEGQLRGVQKMITENRDCRDIMQQLLAIRSAVQSASLSLMQEVASDCLLNFDTPSTPEEQKALMHDLITMMSKVA